MRVRLTAAAIGDIQQAHDWYEKRSRGMGIAFVARVDEAIRSIAANPEVYQKIHPQAKNRFAVIEHLQRKSGISIELGVGQ